MCVCVCVTHTHTHTHTHARTHARARARARARGTRVIEVTPMACKYMYIQCHRTPSLNIFYGTTYSKCEKNKNEI